MVFLDPDLVEVSHNGLEKVLVFKQSVVFEQGVSLQHVLPKLLLQVPEGTYRQRQGVVAVVQEVLRQRWNELWVELVAQALYCFACNSFLVDRSTLEAIGRKENKVIDHVGVLLGVLRSHVRAEVGREQAEPLKTVVLPPEFQRLDEVLNPGVGFLGLRQIVEVSELLLKFGLDLGQL